jgi:hypothetical protein
MSTNEKEDDPILRMLKNRRAEQEESTKLSLEIQKKKIESDKRITGVRIATSETIRRIIRDSWRKW